MHAQLKAYLQQRNYQQKQQMGVVEVKIPDTNQHTKLQKISIDVDVNKAIRPQLGQLLHWSLSEIRKVYQTYQRNTKNPFLDSNMFNKIMPFSKITNNYLFQTFNLSKKYLCIFQLMCALVLTAYTTYQNKLHFLYLLFDFDNSCGISLFQLMFIYKSLIMAYCKLSKSPLPNYANLQTYTKIMFLNADTTDQKQVSLKQMIQKVQTNEEARILFNRFQPENRFQSLKQNYLIFKPFLPYDHQVIQNTFQKINRAYLENKYDDTLQLKIKRQQKLQRKHSLQYRKSHHEIHPKQSHLALLNVFLTVASGNVKKQKSQPHQIKASSASSISKLPKIITNQKNKIPNLYNQYNNDEDKNLNIKKQLMQKIQKRQSDKYIFIRGQTLSKEQVFTLYEYFINLANNNKVINTKEFFESFQNQPCMKKLIGNLYNYLDQNHKGFIQFEEFFKKIYPKVDTRGISLLQKWIKQYKGIYDLDYMANRNTIQVNTQKVKVLPASSMNRLKQMFNALDTNGKGYLTFEDFRVNFKYGFSITQIQNIYKKFDVTNEKKLYLNQFAKMVLPPKFTIEGLEN